ncbi:cupin domain-containing protein [Gallaecimonas mangrovi]|uniref:hypothetical protein n=1 Tax=Gallaecimonas mangrovi TaxID=2291597 RepID=UPI001D00A6BD|nr:hypothetical protein [Gallaecimonas mangrovi]
MADSPVINIQKLTYRSHSHGDQYFARVAPVAQLLGAKELGFRVVRVQPGKKAWPRHAHLNNEEMFFILEGAGTLFMGYKATRCRPVILFLARQARKHRIKLSILATRNWCTWRYRP